VQDAGRAFQQRKTAQFREGIRKIGDDNSGGSEESAMSDAELDCVLT